MRRAVALALWALWALTSWAARPQKAAAVPDSMGRMVELDEVVVAPRHDSYSKRNNPAVDFVTLMRQRSDLADPYRHDYYGYDKYERITLGLTHFADSAKTEFAPHILRVGPDSVATLILSVKEKVSEVTNRRSPRTHREVVKGLKRTGIDDFIDQENVQVFLEEFFREIDLYGNDVTLLGNRFVSPLSRIGPDFYKYWLTDTVTIGTDTCAVLSFVPRNHGSLGFNGRLYAVLGDTTMFVKRAWLRLPPKTNINFIDELTIEQTFVKDSLGNRLLDSDDLNVTLSILPGTAGLYARKISHYSDHTYEPSSRPDIYSRLAEVTMTADAMIRPDDFWDYHRRGDYSSAEADVAELVSTLRSNKLYYWSEKVLKALVTGYIPLDRADAVEYGPVNTTVSFNDLEGTRLRAGYITTANLSRRWFSRAYGAYGTRDHRWKYGVELEYSFVDKRRHSREFPVHSLRLNHSYDTYAPGQQYLFTNPDNIFLSLRRAPDTLQLYRRQTRLQYTLELENRFSFTLAAAATQLMPSRYMPLTMPDGGLLPRLTSNELTLTLRYAPGEKYIQTLSNRIPVNSDAPVMLISHTVAPAGLFGSSPYTLNRTDVMLQYRAWFSAFGYADIIAKGAHVWSRVPFTSLILPNANLSYTIQPETFALLSPMEFILDSYASLDVTYWGNGVIFNYIPLLKQLKWREVVAFRSIWGHLSDKNNPALVSSQSIGAPLPLFPAGTSPVAMTSTPYMEISAGIDNLLHILRVDYVWRLSYRSTPGVDRHGLRIAAHFTF